MGLKGREITRSHNRSKLIVEGGSLYEEDNFTLDSGLVAPKPPIIPNPPSSSGGSRNRDRTPPTLSEIGVNNITVTSAALNFTSNEAGIYYYLIDTAEKEETPDLATIKDQGTQAIAEEKLTLSLPDINRKYKQISCLYLRFCVIIKPGGVANENFKNCI